MKSMKLSVKIVGGFLAVSLVAILLGYIGVSKIGTISEADSDMYLNNTKPLESMAEIGADFQRMRSLLKDLLIGKFILGKDPTESVNKLKELQKTVQEALNNFEKSIDSEAVRKESQSLRSALDQFYPVRDKAIGLIFEGKQEEAFAIFRVDGANVGKKVEEAIGKLFEFKINQAKLSSENNLSIAHRAVLLTWVSAGCGTALALLLGIYLAASIARPINRVVEGLTDASDQVASASSQVSGASQQLAQGASQQAGAIEETASSLEEMSSMTKQNAQHASQANSLMAETSAVVSGTNESMGRLTASMIQISKTSEETSKIIKTIDEIAFQTNLLALNAAVEAARAGEAGAGFAVVADEVRNLAMRAAEAAKNTTNLIEGALKQIKEGSEIAEKTRAEFLQVTTGSAKMTELVAEIAAASSEQAQGIEQVNRAVGEMDKVVQQNAANAEESAAASEEMNAQAHQMKGFIQELVILIRGAADGTAASRKTHLKKNRGEIGRDGRHRQMWTQGQVSTEPAPKSKRTSGNGSLKTALSSTHAKPDQIIPFEEHDMKDF